MRNWRRSDLPRIYANDVVVHRSRVYKRLMVDYRDAIGHALVHIGHVVYVVDGHVVVNIRNLRDVHSRVGYVHVLNITRASSIPWYEHFPWRQRKPSHSTSNTHADAKASTADECNQCRRIDWSNCNRSGDPAPAALYEGPTTVMERCKTPRLIFNPSPPPRRNIDPVTIAVRRPVAGNTRRCPHVSIA